MCFVNVSTITKHVCIFSKRLYIVILHTEINIFGYNFMQVLGRKIGCMLRPDSDTGH